MWTLSIEDIDFSQSAELSEAILQARDLAERCNVPVPALVTPTGGVSGLREFAKNTQLQITIKAVDGGKGREIRFVCQTEELENLARRAIKESPSKQVFAERAAVNGYRHIEVQIEGDSRANIMHIPEYQKVAELAPSAVADRQIVKPVIEAAVRMAEKMGYRSLGTFEFLLNPSTREFSFLEINPRLHVEHAVTKSICAIDIVKAQLLLLQSASFEEAELPSEISEKDWAHSIGKIFSFHSPTGNGVRVDTALVQGAPEVVGAGFDSPVAKVIVMAASWS